ncbi:Transcriptional activator protein LasR [Rhodobacteraceae bacterium THAF1]|uniref:helix-turn-helix transcriptional regulator n=1 Tax=Palleronia sp. THAF1 TaxID=2587842 RepID=UPI000F3E2887|nr:LuxR family transcriptional regulator [Palleronia sp. THAF1]QFU07870.1 Transcriptional activator protein LasR [Palleronia sp. THAF1]VDC25704.1 Transcriptional activator protein LasR [Rhodobacteraceae bacterium THAF1]
MARSREALIEKLGAITDRRALADAISGLTEDFETDHVVYHSVSHIGEEFAAATYSPEWQDHYEDAGLTRIDPVVRGCLQSYGPVHWEQLDWDASVAASMMSDAIDAGVGNQGLSLPIRGPDGQFAVFTLSHRTNDGAWQRQMQDLMSDAILVSHFLNQKALELVDGAGGHIVGQLSPRESDVLSLLAVGQTRSQAADTLGISPHTARVYIESARRKVGAMNTLHAVARAQSLGLLSL